MLQFLKIIAYILLILVIFLVIAILLFLFSSIKYDIKGEYILGQKEELLVKATWIFGIIRIEYDIEKGTRSFILWHEMTKDDKHRKKRKKKVRKRAKSIKEEYSEDDKVNKTDEKKSKKEIQDIKKDIESESIQKKLEVEKVKKKHKSKNETSILEKIKSFFIKTKNKGIHIKNKIESVPETWEEYEMSKVIKLTKDLLKTVYKNIGIQTFDVSGIIGFEDPANTGQLIGLICAVLGFLGLPMMIQGNFEEKDIQLKGYINGKSNVYKIFAPIIKYIFTKPIKRIWKEF